MNNMQFGGFMNNILNNNNSNNQNNSNQNNQNNQNIQYIDSRDLVNSSKGWDLRIFRDEHLARRFLCSLCHNVCRNAHELSCSSAHLFCEQCITELNVSACPICHELNVTHQASRFVARHIKELYVFCPRSKHVCERLMKHGRFNNKTLFCNFSGTLQSLIEHVSSQCIFNVISCPFHLIGCPTKKMYRYELQSHINNGQNKHISLSLQKIQSLQQLLKKKEDSNEQYHSQLDALKKASKMKDETIEKLQFEIEHKYKINHNKLMADCMKLREQLKNANKRIEAYQKAVEILKQNNLKLAKEIDDIKQYNNIPSNNNNNNNNYNAANDVLLQSTMMVDDSNNNNNNNNLNMNRNNNQSSNNSDILSQSLSNSNMNNQNSEVINQFQQLLSLQNNNNNNNINDNDNNISANNIASLNNSSNQSSESLMDDKQANSTDVVCAFLKDHPELVEKLKKSNQIMYANIITDDKYASQFLKKMLETGNEQYRNEISSIVQRLQT